MSMLQITHREELLTLFNKRIFYIYILLQFFLEIHIHNFNVLQIIQIIFLYIILGKLVLLDTVPYIF